MHEAVRTSSEVFASYFEDPRQPRVRARIGSRLRSQGLVTLDGLSHQGRVLDLARVVMSIEPHRDSGPDGLTAIRETGRHAGQAGFAGFGRGELLPHTERSGTARPPRLMLLACLRPGREGGESVLIDGCGVHAELAAEYPEALAALSAERSAFFGGGDGHLGSVFTAAGDGRVAIRLRQDELARFSPEATRHLPVLRAVMDRHRITFRLGTGQAYLLDNHRWLHARTAFAGPRLLYRALGAPLELLRLPAGFPAPQGRPVTVPVLAPGENSPVAALSAGLNGPTARRRTPCTP